MNLRSLGNRAKEVATVAFIKFQTDRNIRRAVVMTALVLAGATLSANTGAQDVATSLNTNAMPYLRLGLRVFGGMIALGGFVVGFNGFTGRDEGFEKVFKIGMGFVGIALGIMCIGKTEQIIQWLNLDKAFDVS